MYLQQQRQQQSLYPSGKALPLNHLNLVRLVRQATVVLGHGQSRQSTLCWGRQYLD